ncbi:MAG: hypothetical protein ACK515_09720 [bacterium]|jgi:hypothetical protein|nr:hypothetical protein [Betaproteobacteria bacterium]
MNTASLIKLASVSAVLALSASPALAATITWANWTSTTAATAGTVGITFTGQGGNLDIDARNWQPVSTWADGVVIGNAPVAGSAIRTRTGGGSQLNTVTFPQAVLNPVFAIWSLGQPNNSADFTFDQLPTFVAGGGAQEYGGIPISVSGNVVRGTGERNGSVIFYGTFQGISWTNPIFENCHGFTVGFDEPAASVVPVPAAAWLLGTGLLGLVGCSRGAGPAAIRLAVRAPASRSIRTRRAP